MREAPQSARGVPRVGQQARAHDPGSDPGDPAGSAPAGSARRRPLRDQRPQRPLPPRDQPQQPPEAAAGAERARGHHPQRKADAAGGGGRAVRQRPARARDHGPEQAPAEVAQRHAEGQAGPLPPELARQARGLLGPFGDRGWPRAAPAPVRAAVAHGARAVQAVHLQQARAARLRHHHQGRQEDGRARAPRGVGHPRGGDQGAPGHPEPRSDAAPPRHAGLRAGADRRQGDPAPPAGVQGLQRRLRRRSDGRARAALGRGADRGARADDVHQQHPQPRDRPPDHRPEPGHRAGLLLHDARAARCQRRRSALREPRGSARRVRLGRARHPRGPEDAHERCDGRHDDGPRVVVRDRAAGDSLPVHQPGDGQEGARRADRPGLSPPRQQGDGAARRSAAHARLRERDARRRLHLSRRHDGAARQGALHHGGAGAGGRGREPVPRRPDQRRRAVQQGDRHLGERDREDRGSAAREPRRVEGQELEGSEDPELQLHLHDGRLGRARFGATDPPAGRHARPDGEAFGRDHRDADHLELPRRSLGAAVLHLDARRAQGPRRHRAQDGQLRLSDAPSRRRRAGRDHPPDRLSRGRAAVDTREGRAEVRHPDDRAGRGWRHHRGHRRAHPRPHGSARRARSGDAQGPGEAWRRDQRGPRQDHRGGRRRRSLHSLGAHLPRHARRVREVLWARSRARQHGQHGRGGRRDRGAVDRRAGHAAHDAHLPHRRRGDAARGSLAPRDDERGHGALLEPAHGEGSRRAARSR